VSFGHCRRGTADKQVIIRNYDFPIEYIKNINYCFPDLAVFIQKIKFLNNLEELDQQNYNIIIYDEKVYIVAENITKLYYIIELLDQYKILVDNTLCDSAQQICNLQSIDDILYIQNMKEEKYRM
jgi:hypothetical protein